MTIKELFNHPIVNLDKQVRYSNLKVMFPENVAEHSEIVTNLAIIIAFDMMKECPDVKIDIKDIALRGVVHDWGEAWVCDVTTDVKYSNPEIPKVLEILETKGLKKSFDDDSFIEYINRAREGSIEGDIIMLADRLQAYFKMFKEYMIQRTASWKDAIIRNAIPAINKHLTDLLKYYNTPGPDGRINHPTIIDNLIIGLQESRDIIMSKVDFL